MGDYLTDVQLLGSELARVQQAFRGLTNCDWRRPTLLQPPVDTLPPWTIFELAGHLDIAVGVTRLLISSQQDGQVGRDRVSFFIFPRSQVAPLFYDYAYTMVEGKSPGQMADVLAETFTRTIDEVRGDLPGCGREVRVRRQRRHAHAAGRVRAQPDGRGGRAWPGPH
jgi:hypothetical protein